MNGTGIPVALIGLAGLVLGYLVNAVLGIVRQSREDFVRSDERAAAKLQRRKTALRQSNVASPIWQSSLSNETMSESMKMTFGGECKARLKPKFC